MATEVVLTETLIEALEQFESERATRILGKLDEVESFPEHYLDRLKNHPGYKLRVGDDRVLIDWDRGEKTIYAIDVFERKTDYRELGTYRDVWASRRDEQ